MNWNILVAGGKENNSDSLSSGERTGNSPNQLCVGVVGPRHGSQMVRRTALKGRPQKVQALYSKIKWRLVESWVRRGTWNPVGINRDHPVRLNTPNWPIVNQYHEGKVKRTAGAEWNRSWNRMLTTSQSPLMGDGVPFVEWTGELPCRARLSRKYGAVAKASLNRAIVRRGRPETRRSSHDQVEGWVIPTGGPNRPPLKSWRMNCG